MLAKQFRLAKPSEFSWTIKQGRKANSRTAVVYFLAARNLDDDYGDNEELESVASPKIGFVVSKAVGGSVTRNKVVRQLRHIARTHLETLPPGSLTVVRALPASAHAGYDKLDTDFDAALVKLVRGTAKIETSA